jgi:hypothetical protein
VRLRASAVGRATPTWDGRRRLATAALALAAGAIALHAAAARAVVVPATTIDGPSEEIAGFGGVAMAEDGTGGLVYLKRVAGVAHVFVSRYAGGRWLAPIRVDTEEPFAASWPRVGAANGGELLVTWATPFATSKQRPVDELLGATLGAGSSTFGRAIIIDPDIGEGTGASPDLAMSSTGQADIVYRVVSFQSNVPLLRPGDVVESVRVARFGGTRWAQLGAINRNPSLSMRPPTSANAPAIAIGPTGNGVVVWQEPEINGVARIWARRVFGQSLDYVMPVSTPAYNGASIGDDADAPSVAVSPFGEAAVVYRQGASAGTPLPGPRVFLNLLPDGESSSGAEFTGAIVADTAVAGGLQARIGRPSVDIDEKQNVRLLYDDNGESRVIVGNDKGLAGTLSLGSHFVGSLLAAPNELPSASVMNPAGGGISAWPSADSAGSPALAVREDFPDGAVQTGLISAGAGGPIGELAVGRSSLGDGIVAFQQGALGNAAIVAAQVTAPPKTFVINVPRGWVKPPQASVAWVPAASANGPLTYSVVLDGHVLPTPAGASQVALPLHYLGDGVHQVRLLATDIYGQATLTAPAPLRIDGRPPVVRVTRAQGGYGVVVRISDDQSGVYARAVRVSFGDGQSGRGRTVFSHRYARAGIYRVVVTVRDKLGNAGVVSVPVSAR